ncbi:ABC transporter ATP-binding protein/permease [Janibacter sp. Y6]|uniref:ABC transporter ATP-binding protein n=1 Tax=Janibacter sp. Y6 TaxID=2913552 RepID=UPI0034A58BA8
MGEVAVEQQLRRRGQLATILRALRIIGWGVRVTPGTFALAVVGSVIFGVATAGMAWAVGWVTEHHVTPAVTAGEVDGGRLAIIFGAIAAVVAATTVGVLGRRIFGAMVMYGIAADYRRRVTRQYLRLPLTWHHRHPSGQLLSNANADVEATWFVFMPLPMALGVLVMLAFGLVQMALVDPVMMLVGLTCFPLLMIANGVYQRRMTPLATTAQQLRAEVSEVAHESLEAALVVKSMGAEERETRRFAEVTGRLRQANIAVGRTRGTFDPVIEAIPQLATLVVLAAGTARVGSGAMTPAEVVQVAYLIAVLAFPVRAFGWVLGELPRTVVAYERVERVLQESGHTTHGPRRLDGRGPVELALEGVSFRYESAERTDLAERDEDEVAASVGVPDRPLAVDGVDLRIAPGRTVALVGPTGSGKSTLAALTTRLLETTAGTVRYDGVDLTELAAGEVSRAAALVPQGTFLFDDTVRGNITLGEQIDDDAVERALRLAQAWDFVGRLPHGLDTEVGERGASLSGGQRQRLALARAVVREPRLLVLDDATSAVDPSVELAILHGLQERSGGSTVLLVAYRLSTIALADEVVHLEGGRVVDRGTHAELLGRDASYAHLVTAYARQADERAERAERAEVSA